MLTFLLVAQAIIALSMIIVILLQNNSSDGLSGLGGSSGGKSLISSRASANILTRTTAILATLFMLNCLVMATLAARKSNLDFEFSTKSLSTEKVIKDNDKKEAAPAIPLAD